LALLILAAIGTSSAKDRPIAADEFVSAGEADPIARARMLRGQYGVAAARLRSELNREPDAIENEALLAVAEAGNGAYPDAWAAFDAARVVESYDRHAIAAHADVLRFLGQPGEAASVRLEQLWMPISQMAELKVFLDRVDDLRSDGNLESALDSATMALAIAPERGAAYAQLAQVRMDLGEWDAARADLHVADRLGPRSNYIARASVRLLLHDGAIHEAREIALSVAQDDPDDLALRAMRAEVATATGDAAEGLRLTGGKRFRDTEHPQLLLARIHAQQGLGDVQEARQSIERFRAIYSRSVLNALGSLERPSPI
jgi:tetratricopeptide (TPR) repeat protein